MPLLERLVETLRQLQRQLRSHHRRRLAFLNPPIERRRPRIQMEDYAARHSIDHTLGPQGRAAAAGAQPPPGGGTLPPVAHLRAARDFASWSPPCRPPPAGATCTNVWPRAEPRSSGWRSKWPGAPRCRPWSPRPTPGERRAHPAGARGRAGARALHRRLLPVPLRARPPLLRKSATLRPGRRSRCSSCSAPLRASERCGVAVIEHDRRISAVHP